MQSITVSTPLKMKPESEVRKHFLISIQSYVVVLLKECTICIFYESQIEEFLN